jgi:hypothetical protein
MSWGSDCAHAAADSSARDNALNDASSYSKRSADLQDAHSLESGRVCGLQPTARLDVSPAWYPSP